MIALLSRILSRKPAAPEPFPWRGDLEACRKHCLAKWSAARSDRTRRGNITRAAQRRAGA